MFRNLVYPYDNDVNKPCPKETTREKYYPS